MQYATRPVFAGDDWGELRDAMHSAAAWAMRDVASQVNKFVQLAAIATGSEREPIVQELRAEIHFDLRPLYIANGILSAYWRYSNGHIHSPLPGTTDLFRICDDYIKWATTEVSYWFLDNPILLRRFSIVMAVWQSQRALSAMADLNDSLKDHYPMPQPDTNDLFDPIGV